MPDRGSRRKPRKDPLPKGPERTRVAAELRELYEKGITIRGIAAVTDWSYSTVHRLLTEAGTKFRPARRKR
ncbi:helix-turn-helix domain-containing protein [Streptomyces filamentosus]|uniref:Helix-turn-helix domain-containing protein n=1 Tax=Streptomyces filamentosus TaxID=67294 RepID=A0A919BQM5_STRFL|nr:helix-turn-helix domain-containing protein [Streptomyces filamentosus]GHG05622.1 hypothetical protein GCM10017667_40610 [Streptomyces filamentosus]